MSLVHTFLRDTSERRPSHPALYAEDRASTFGELELSSDVLADHLQDRGVRRGDRTVLCMDNSIEMIVSLFAVLKAGAVAVPLSPGTKPAKLAYILKDCGARTLVTQARLAEAVERAAVDTLEHVLWADTAPVSAPGRETLPDLLASPLRPPRDPNLIDADLALIIYTSGSTGSPKGVMLTHANVTNTAWAISTYLENTPDDVVICVLPLSFDYGLYQTLTGARVGFAVVLERSLAFPYQIWQRITTHNVTGLPGVPTVFAALLQLAEFQAANAPRLRYFTNTAAPFPPAHIRRLAGRFPAAKIFSMYGLTECTRVGYLDPSCVLERPASVGRAMPNSEAFVVDEQGRRVGPGVVGELVVRGANVMRGYWGDPVTTAERLRDGDIPGEKVLYSGDLFYTDDEGLLYFVGRKDDVFKCRGEKVSPREVEAVLYELEGVAEAAVVGVDDPVDGQAVKAFVTPRPGHLLDEQQLRRHCRARLEAHLVPKRISICAELPKTDSGKIRKRSLVDGAPPTQTA
jgi:long-chain acyl-CoA synthetase